MKAYIYPNTSRNLTGTHNPYIGNFVEALSESFDFVNEKAPSNVGILDLWKYLWKIDIVFLNWIEDITSKKGGKMQWHIFNCVFLPILKFRKVKICWTLHNKQSHSEKNRKNKNIHFKRLFSVSDYIITHAGEGKSIISSKGYTRKLIFFHHPINEKDRVNFSNKEIDIFIWGTIAPYKGIDSFLDQVSQSSILKKYKILIAGKIIDDDYKYLINKKLSSNVQLIDNFLTDKELEENLRRSKITLFTYNKDSVLSSGALSDSIGYGNIIVGPEVGSFKDLKKLNLIYTYKDRNFIPKLCEKILSNFDKYQIDESLTVNYLNNCSWKKFGETIIDKIEN